MESGSGLKTTITGDAQIEITGGAFFVGKIVLMSGLETAKVFSPRVCARARACGKQLHLLLRRSLPPLMISDDIIRQSAHKQMLAALQKRCQLSRCALAPTYYLYRAFKFVMVMTPCVSMQAAAHVSNAPRRPRRRGFG